jgi:hypothetical protein
MQLTIHRSLSVVGDITTQLSADLSGEAPCEEWPVVNGCEDKQALNAHTVPLDRNAGWPTGRKAQGNGASRVLVGVTPYQGAWESQVQGKGRQVLRQISQGTVREAPLFNQKRTGKAVKNWRAVCGESCKHGSGRGGWKRTGLDTVGKVFRQVESTQQHRAGRLLYRQE